MEHPVYCNSILNMEHSNVKISYSKTNVHVVKITALIKDVRHANGVTDYSVKFITTF